MNGGMRLRSRVLLRSRWRAVVAIGVIAGLLAGGLVALATAARETGRSLDTYMDRLGAPDVAAVFCGPADEASDPADCFDHDQRDVLPRLRSDERVVAAGRLAPAPTLMRHGSDPWVPMFAYVTLDDLTGFRRPPVVDGVPADPDDPGQVMINETLAREHGIAVGDRLEIAPITWDQLGANQIPEAPGAPAVLSRVAAILRTPDDLQADGSAQLQVSEASLFLGPGWAQAVGEDHFARYSMVVGMELRPGVEPDGVIDDAAAGRPASVLGPLWDVRAFDEAIRYDARAAYAATTIAVLAAVVFLAQLAARQARRELDDAEPLRALGATRGQVVQSVLPRWAISAGTATAVAVPLAMLLRPLGPIGLGRQLVDSPATSLDPVVASAGLGLMAAVMLGVAILTTWFAAGPARARAARPYRHPAPMSASPTAATGLALGSSATSRRWTTTTVLAAGATVAVAVAAMSVLASLRHLTSEPSRFGVTWDMSAASVFGPASAEEMVRTISELPGVEAVAGVIGNDARIGDDQIYAYALAPVGGLPEGIAPVVTRGRAPSAPGEIALGALTMRRAGVDLGDTVPLRYLDRVEELVVVGEAVINDGYEDLPGAGAIVDHRWVESADSQNFATDVLVRFEPESRQAGMRAMEVALPDTALPPLVQSSIRDLQRIDSWLSVLTMFAAVLATATFAHALIVTVRRQRRQLGILRALGFSRRQVRASVAWLASLIAVAAVVVGIPVGTALGRWGWGRIAHNLGVPPVPVVPLIGVIAVTAIALGVANLVALPLGWRAARVPAVEALRAE